MMASGLYGALFALAMIVFARVAPQPLGTITFWSLVSLQLAWHALTCWRRTGLPFATAAMINGSLVSAGVATLAAIGQPFPNMAPASWVLFTFAAATGPALFFIEQRVNAELWAEWQRRMEHKTPWDIVIGRHIPHLRKTSA